jgi:uncharacterized integral membrane protein
MSLDESPTFRKRHVAIALVLLVLVLSAVIGVFALRTYAKENNAPFEIVIILSAVCGAAFALLLCTGRLVRTFIAIFRGDKVAARMRQMKRPISGFKCPYCGLFNPPNAEKCDCGHAFEWSDSSG